MELVERAGFLSTLQSQFETVLNKGEGHCVFVSGEAGIGKTSLVKTFCTGQKKEYNIYQGTCDALFTPRPLAPLYDILLQLGKDVPESSSEIADRTAFFTRVFQELRNQDEASILVFEDIHWADEATLDFIKFLARRITQLKCLFILTYRDNEIHSRHPLRNVLGHLTPGSFVRMELLPLSREAVEKMAEKRGYNGENVYSISGGNPFYVTEILASYSVGIPDNIRDSILSIYTQLDDKTKHVWDMLSVLPKAFEAEYFEMIEPAYAPSIENCLAMKILIMDKGLLFFKHELYRRTIEASLSPLVRVALNKKILEFLVKTFEQTKKIEQIIHHAKNANDYELVVKYAPMAARQAATVGAHIEASRLYLSAIEYYQGNDPDILIHFYESYAYECYLTSQIKDAIIYTSKALNLWKAKNDTEKIGNSLRFLSRLWWFEANGKQAESFGQQAIDVLEDQPSSKAKAMAYSNMSQLKMLSGQSDACVYWGEKAIALSKELGDDEVLAHALNNVGTVQMKLRAATHQGIDMLRQSLDIALKNSYQEHAARAYTNLGSIGVIIREYDIAKQSLEEGIRYCEERDLDSWTDYMLCWKARLDMLKNNWKEAYTIADNLLKNESITTVVRIGALVIAGTIMARTGQADAASLLLEAKAKAFESRELQRIIPALIGLLECEWITGNRYIKPEELDLATGAVAHWNGFIERSEFAYWLYKARKQKIVAGPIYEGYDMMSKATAINAATFWEKSGCSYEYALALFEGTDDDKRKAIAIVHSLGGNAVYEKLKLEMRTAGIRNIPRGIRKSTQSNPAQLTDRELDVLQLLHEGMQNKEIASKLFISAKTVDHHISAILFKLEVNSRVKAVQEAIRLEIIK